MTQQPKPKNRYRVVSNANEVLTKFFEDNKYERLSDMYEELGEYSGVSPSTISQMRHRNVAPSYTVAMKIAEYIGVAPTDIWAIEEVEDYQGRPKCTVEGCGRVATSKGLCMRHVYMLRDIHEGRRVDQHKFR